MSARFRGHTSHSSSVGCLSYKRVLILEMDLLNVLCLYILNIVLCFGPKTECHRHVLLNFMHEMDLLNVLCLFI